MDHADLDIRDLSVRCGACMNYRTLVSFSKRDGWHVYAYACEPGTCDSASVRTILELPAEIDVFARRHPDCGGA